MEQWFISSKRADFYKLGEQLHINPVLVRLMRNRDMIDVEEMDYYLNGTLSELHDPMKLKDAEKAAKIIKQKISAGKRMRIISDYDVDGVSSNYILYQGLKRCGANVDYKIPDRVEDGYGINEHLILQAKQDGIETIITCDNGIAAKKQIDYGNNMGIDFIITDHHDIPYEEKNGKITYLLPDALAVVNPKQEDCPYPWKNICGAVVCYKLMQMLYRMSDIPEKEVEEFLEIAALATVCDVMPLKDENRIIVKEGLKKMQGTQIQGMEALLEVNQLAEKEISSYHLGFVVGPCVNASGRLASAKDALELFLCEDREQCLEKAKHLKELNDVRKDLTSKGVEDALVYLEETGRCRDKVLIVYLKDCHESIAGIIAGRIKEHYNKPVFVLTKTKEGIKGSGRSIEGYHMFDEMTKVKDCFTKFGGHPMAAGLSMQEDKVEEFRIRINENCSLTESDFDKKIMIDIAIPIDYLSEGFIDELKILEPFGNGNDKPLFAVKNLNVKELRVLGNTGRCVKMIVQDENNYRIEALYFGESKEFIKEIENTFGVSELKKVSNGLPSAVKMHVTYYPQVNEWNHYKTLQIVIKNYKWLKKG